jgi:hypothetical protein
MKSLSWLDSLVFRDACGTECTEVLSGRLSFNFSGIPIMILA